MYMKFNWIGDIVARPEPKFFSCPVISGTNMEWGGIYDNSADPRGQAVERWLQTNGTTTESVVEKYNIGYIVLAKEADWDKYAWLNNLPDWRVIQDSATIRVYQYGRQ